MIRTMYDEPVFDKMTNSWIDGYEIEAEEPTEEQLEERRMPTIHVKYLPHAEQVNLTFTVGNNGDNLKKVYNKKL